jgi:hypothetical protein
MAQQPYPSEEPVIGWWDAVFTPEVRARYAQVGVVYPDNDRAFRWSSRTAYDIAAGLTKEASLAKHLIELEQELGIHQPAPGHPTARPLVGPLRIENKLFRDDRGYRRVLFCSWFPALRILRDNPAEFDRQLNAIAAAGYQGIRIFLAVGGWTPYWDGCEVVPMRFQKAHFDGHHLRPIFDGPWLEAWPDYDDLLRTLLRACRPRDLRLHVTTGDMQIMCPDPNQELDLHRRFARICGEEGGADLIALAEVTNEFPINRFGGDSAASIAQMGRVIDVWDRAMPGVITAMGAIPQNEEPASLAKASTHGDACAVHVTRSPFETCLKHTFGLVNWEGNWRAFPKPYWAGEPAGPGHDSFDRLDDPASLVALHAMHALIGMGAVWFQGAAVRSYAPLESEWGFAELPAILSILPEDVATWDHGANAAVGGIMYFWRDQQFATATMSQWNTMPPRPVSSWTLHQGTSTRSGTGTPPNNVTGMITGLFGERT